MTILCVRAVVVGFYLMRLLFRRRNRRTLWLWRGAVHVVNVAVEDSTASTLGTAVILIIDGFAAVLLRELTGKGDASRKSDEIRNDVNPPLMGLDAEGCHGGMGCTSRTANQGTYLEYATEEHGHVVMPALTQFFPKFFHRLHRRFYFFVVVSYDRPLGQGRLS